MKGCRPFSNEEIKRIFSDDSLQKRDQTWFLLGCCTGFRITELLRLQIHHVLQRGELTDSVYMERRFMKRKREGRHIALNDEAKTVLRLWIDELKASKQDIQTDTYLFQGYAKNKPLSRQHASLLLSGVCDRLKITGKVNTHSMRKTFAMRIYEISGGDVRKVQEALGHSDIATTVKYLPLNFDKIKILVEKISYLSDNNVF